MVQEVEDAKLLHIREEATHLAKLLLCNWVAWGLFEEERQKGA